MTSRSQNQSKCPNCKQAVQKQENAFFPFCSEQCRLIDLGKWLEGGYAVPGSDSPSSPDSPDGEI